MTKMLVVLTFTSPAWFFLYKMIELLENGGLLNMAF